MILLEQLDEERELEIFNGSQDAKNNFSADSNTVFIHTGGLPSLFVAH